MERGSLGWKLVKLCSLYLPILFSIPALYALFRRPSNHQFLRALQCCSLCFVVFCYQLNEKGIMFPLFSLHLSIFDLDPYLFFGLFFSSPMTLRNFFSQEHEIVDPTFILSYVFFAPLLFLTYRLLMTIPSAKTPQIPLKSLFLDKIPLTTRIVSLKKLLTVLSIIGFTIIEILNLIFPRPGRLPYLWYVLNLHVLVLFWIGCLFLLTIEMFIHPEAISVFDSYHHLLKKPIKA